MSQNLSIETAHTLISPSNTYQNLISASTRVPAPEQEMQRLAIMTAHSRHIPRDPKNTGIELRQQPQKIDSKVNGTRSAAEIKIQKRMERKAEAEKWAKRLETDTLYYYRIESKGVSRFDRGRTEKSEQESHSKRVAEILNTASVSVFKKKFPAGSTTPSTWISPQAVDGSRKHIDARKKFNSFAKQEMEADRDFLF